MNASVIDIEGTPLERGKQCGEALRAHLSRAWDSYLSHLAVNPLRPSREDVIKRSRYLVRRIAEYDPDGADFLEGQANGSGLGTDAIVALRTMLEISLYWNQFPAMCSSAGIRLLNGEVVIGQTIDWYPDGAVVPVRETREDGRKRLSLYLEGNPFYHLTSDGMANCANSILHHASGLDVELPLSFYVDLAMRQPTLDGALSVLRRFGRGTGYFLLADECGAIGLETQGTDHETFEGESVLHTNHYLCPRFCEGDLGIQYLPDTAPRLSVLNARFGQRPNTMFDMLDRLCAREGVGRTNLWLEQSDAVPPFSFATLAAFVANPSERKMELRLRSGHEIVNLSLAID